MTGLRKKLVFALFAALVAVCLSAGVMLAAPVYSSAAETPSVYADETPVEVSGSGFTYSEDGKTLTGLKGEESGSFIAVVPETVEVIGAGAFLNNKNLKEVRFAATSALKEISANAFTGCSKLETIGWPESLTAPATTDTRRTFVIGANAFDGCTSLTQITIPAYVTQINGNAFANCTAVTRINYYAINSNSIASSPFAGLNAAKNVEVVIGNTDTHITYIPSYLFSGTNIKKVTISNVNLNGDIGFKDYIFANCKYLTEVNFTDGSSIPTIGAGVFDGCELLKDINLAGLSSLTTIGERAFYGCSSLYQVAIPSNVENIGQNAFANCNRLVEIDNLSGLAITAGKPTISTTTVFGTGVKHVYNSSNSETSYIDNKNGFIFYDDEKESADREVLLISYVGNETVLDLPDDVGSYKIYSRAFFNNTKLTEVSIPSQVTELNSYAFCGCTSLNKVTFSASTVITAIGNNAFDGCVSLTQIDIPASVRVIDAYAFRNCSKLNTVNFVSKNTLTTIDTSAFLNCRALALIEIPVSVKTFGADAFKGCTNLSIVYLPESLQSPSHYTVSGLFDTDTKDSRLLIAPSVDSYSSYESYVNTWSAYGTLTYEVPVYLVYSDYKKQEETNAQHHIDYKLFGLDYTYKKDGNIWSMNGGMPVQHGYSQSVWYEDEEHCLGLDAAYVVTSDRLNAILGVGEDVNIISHLNLWANYSDYSNLEFTFKPLTGNNAADIGPNYDAQDPAYAISSCKLGEVNLTEDKYTVEIAGYLPVAGSVSSLPTMLKNAGTYTLRVNLNKEVYGQWDINDDVVLAKIQKDFEVAPVTYSLGKEGLELKDYINWGVAGQSTALSPEDTQTLYIYSGTPYLTKQDKFGTATEVNVSSSYLIYQPSGWTIDLKVGAEYLQKIVGYTDDDKSVATETGIHADATGIYTAKATFISSNNYRFEYIAPANDPYGLTISETKTAEGYRYEVTKVWYIVTADASMLIGDNGSKYSITGWTYGDKVPGKPILSSESTHGKEEQLITFTLENELILGETVTPYNYARYDDVINSSMPVGSYVLTVYVADYTPAGGNLIAGNGAKGERFEFDVTACSIDTLLAKLKAENKLSGTADLWGDLYTTQTVKKSFEVEYNHLVQFAPTSGVPVLKLEEKDIHNRQGIWASKDYDNYYGKFKIEYNVDTATGGLGGNVYYTAENYLAGPANPGKYTVYFNVYANNYTKKIDTSSETIRKQYYYTLYIKQYIDLSAIDLGTVTYTGNAVRFTDTDIYKFVYLDGKATDADTQKAYALFCSSGAKQDYVKANDSVAVALMIRQNVADYYGWKNGTVSVYSPGTANEQAFAKVTFAIERADNRATTPLYLRDWEWGKETNFSIQWATYYGNAQTDYTFSLQSVKDPTLVYYYKPTSTQLGFDKADAGEYTLIATAAGGDGYDWKVLRETRPLTILQSRVTLETNPYIESWKYGDFAQMYKAPECELSAGFTSLQSQVTSYITRLSDYNAYLNGTLAKDKMTVWPTVNDMRDAGGEVPAGSYVYVYELPQSGNYAEWAHEVYFSVLKVMNYWDTTPTVHDWVYGDYTTRDTTIDCKPHFGNKNSVIYYYRLTGVSGWVTEIPQDWLDRHGELSVGRYEFRAFLAGNENYEQLDSYMYFNVTRAKNSWTEDGIPGVKSWSQGKWNSKDNALTAQAKYGTVVYEVYSTSDTEHKNAYDIKDLNSLNVGSYVLVAKVEGTDNYEELVGEATFAVFEDSVGMTGLIAATAVFAAIAIGLAVSGVVLLIIRNKKIEEEFRKMIKSELRRK
ncbi:MAG: leucine-rich repeat domain-containing protein [Clostridia bacterium]|nr:leucine-rich repeat domain-containing protein [Clostridia bacterium]